MQVSSLGLYLDLVNQANPSDQHWAGTYWLTKFQQFLRHIWANFKSQEMQAICPEFGTAGAAYDIPPSDAHIKAGVTSHSGATCSYFPSNDPFQLAVLHSCVVPKFEFLAAKHVRKFKACRDGPSRTSTLRFTTGSGQAILITWNICIS
jgi:hypothetical protein